jgi:hypothetical protein
VWLYWIGLGVCLATEPTSRSDRRRMRGVTEIYRKMRSVGCQNGASCALWHREVERAPDLVGETLVRFGATVEMATLGGTAAAEMARLTGDLETYVCGQSELIIN